MLDEAAPAGAVDLSEQQVVSGWVVLRSQAVAVAVAVAAAVALRLDCQVARGGEVAIGLVTGWGGVCW